MVTNIIKREKCGHCTSCWNYEIHSMKYFLPKHQPKRDQVSGYSYEFMGNTVLEWHVKYDHRVGNQKNPACGQLYRTSLKTFISSINCKENERGRRSCSLKET